MNNWLSFSTSRSKVNGLFSSHDNIYKSLYLLFHINNFFLILKKMQLIRHTCWMSCITKCCRGQNTVVLKITFLLTKNFLMIFKVYYKIKIQLFALELKVKKIKFKNTSTKKIHRVCEKKFFDWNIGKIIRSRSFSLSWFPSFTTRFNLGKTISHFFSVVEEEGG